MFIFRIIGLLLTMSPISFETNTFFFPYSFLGLTLYFLAFIFDDKKSDTFKTILLLLWSLCFYYILVQQSFIYQIGLAIFVLADFYLKGLSNEKGSIIAFIGIILCCVGFLFPVFLIISLVFSSIFDMYTHINTKRKTNSTCSTSNLSVSTMDINEDMIINTENSIQEGDDDQIIPY